MNIASRQWLVPVMVVGLGAVFAESATAFPITFSAAGSNAASIQGTVDAFRSVLGGPDNRDAAGSQPMGRRELNWDLGTGSTFTIPTPTTDYFASHGALLSTPGIGFFIFPNSYPPFSPPNVLRPMGSNVLDVLFTVPQTIDPAATRGFGAVFADVDLAATTSLSFFDSMNNSLGTYYASAFNNGLSFLGVAFSEPQEMIARVRISLGTANGADIVSLDNIVFGEPGGVGAPQPVPEPGMLMLFGVALALVAMRFGNQLRSSARKVCALALVAVAPGLAHAELIYGLQGSNRIVSFDSAAPMALQSNRVITGLGASEVLVGLDLRPANDRLYSLSMLGNLYSIIDTGPHLVANLIGNIGVPSIGSNFGFDFNPTTDRLRVVNDSDQNLRLNPNNAVSIVDGSINPSDLNLVGSAYTNNFAGATSTTLYGIDTLTASLMRSVNPNAGTYVSVGSLGLGPIGTDARIGFDISGTTGIGYLGINDLLYTVDLMTGVADYIGSIGATNVRGLTVGPRLPVAVTEPATWSMMLLGFAVMVVAMRRRLLRR